MGEIKKGGASKEEGPQKGGGGERPCNRFNHLAKETKRDQ